MATASISPSLLTSLPPDALVHIITFTSPLDMTRLRAVCRRFGLPQQAQPQQTQAQEPPARRGRYSLLEATAGSLATLCDHAFVAQHYSIGTVSQFMTLPRHVRNHMMRSLYEEWLQRHAESPYRDAVLASLRARPVLPPLRMPTMRDVYWRHTVIVCEDLGVELPVDSLDDSEALPELPPAQQRMYDRVLTTVTERMHTDLAIQQRQRRFSRFWPMCAHRGLCCELAPGPGFLACDEAWLDTCVPTMPVAIVKLMDQLIIAADRQAGDVHWVFPGTVAEAVREVERQDAMLWGMYDADGSDDASTWATTSKRLTSPALQNIHKPVAALRPFKRPRPATSTVE